MLLILRESVAPLLSAIENGTIARRIDTRAYLKLNEGI